MTTSLPTGMSVRAMEWLESRGLDVEIADRHNIASRGSGSGEVLIYPLYSEGRVATRKYRRLEPQEGEQRFFCDKGGGGVPFNEDCLRDDSLLHLPLVITEGYEDCMAVEQAGHMRVISVPDGAPEKPVENVDDSKKYEWVDRLWHLLKADRVPHIILAVDGDSAGAALMHDLSIKLGKVRCKYVVYPKVPEAKTERYGRSRLKDMNEVLLEYGVEGVRKTIGRAEFIKVSGVYKMSELPIMADSVIYDIGFDGLGENFRMRLGDVSVWTGVPSHGKTTMLNDITCRVIKKYGIRLGIASFEQDPQRDHRRALRSWYHEEYEPKLTVAQKREADDWIDEHFRFLIPDEDQDPTLEWLLEMWEIAVIQHGCKVLVVDPWNEAVHVRDPGESETDYTNRVLREICRFAKRFQVHICIVAHPRKLERNGDGTYPIPSAYDISGSSAWYNKPAQVVIVHRISEEESICKVQKSRYHELLGKPGIMKFHYSLQTRRFYELERVKAEEPKRRRT